MSANAHPSGNEISCANTVASPWVIKTVYCLANGVDLEITYDPINGLVAIAMLMIWIKTNRIVRASKRADEAIPLQAAMRDRVLDENGDKTAPRSSKWFSGVYTGYVASHRRPWHALAFPRPPIFATYMARQAPAFPRSPNGLGSLNIAHGLYPGRDLDSRAVNAVVDVLDAIRALCVGRGRTYHGVLEKFEPREMEALPLG
ncbi:MAG: hypothetical protein IAI50_09230, partial [Candidatus Eremiobacteraeota bacterium]|nr:hypothetical protein [Candidatus Eremiobacteraeota bacterium]